MSTPTVKYTWYRADAASAEIMTEYLRRITVAERNTVVVGLGRRVFVRLTAEQYTLALLTSNDQQNIITISDWQTRAVQSVWRGIDDGEIIRWGI